MVMVIFKGKQNLPDPEVACEYSWDADLAMDQEVVVVSARIWPRSSSIVGCCLLDFRCTPSFASTSRVVV